jgi:hypothetical protein
LQVQDDSKYVCKLYIIINIFNIKAAIIIVVAIIQLVNGRTTVSHKNKEVIHVPTMKFSTTDGVVKKTC